MYNDILLAIDLEDETSWAKAAPQAVELAQAFGAELHLMTVVPDFGMSIVASFFPDDFEKKTLDEVSARLHAWVEGNIPENVKVQHIVGHGKAYEEVLKMADQTNCDLIVLGARHPEKQEYLLGPTSARVVRHAKQSVLVVRD